MKTPTTPSEPSTIDLEGFERYLHRRGRAGETIRAYKSQLRKCLERGDDDLTEGATARLLDKSLAPKSRRVALAALMAWGRYAKDGTLMSEISEIKLPPPMRVKPKVELNLDEWRSLLEVLQKPCKGIADATRWILLIVSLRGIRIGDVLRLKRDDVLEAVKTGTLSYEAKGGRRLEYNATPIMEPLRGLAEIRHWKTCNELVCDFDASERLINIRVARALKKIAKRAKVAGVHPHRMRRTYATHFVRRLQNDPQALIKLTKHMGWTNINTAAQYVDNVNRDETDKVGDDLLADLLGKPHDPSGKAS